MLIVPVLILIINPVTIAQVAQSELSVGSDYDKAMELFGKEKYAAAINLFDNYIAGEGDIKSITLSEALYFRAISSVRLFNPDAEYRIVNYIRKYPESPRLNDARMELAGYFYQNKNHRKAITYFEEVNRQDLKADELPSYFFRLGYSHYLRGDKSRALLMFSEIKDIDTEYTPPALYYFSQIAYEKQMYETAFEGFERLKEDDTFGPIVPFYIVQILYMRKDYDRILEMGPGMIKSAPAERAIELYRFIGDAYFNKEMFVEALPYLEKFSAESKIGGREDKYQLGYTYYKTGQIDKAIPILLAISSGSDILSQNIWYVLGDCYLKKGDKKRAQFGFAQASKLNHDKRIAEDALFNYAKITLETSYSPFGEAIASFQEYIDLYPGSPRIEEAYNYLVSTYLQARNYRAALASLDKIKTRDVKMEEAYQRVAFYRGLELFKNIEMQAAIDMFDKSLKFEKYDRQLRARATYWRGEANYRLGNYEAAKVDYQTFMGIPGSMLLSEYNLVRYNLGYSFFNLEDYNNAISHFKAYENSVATAKPEMIADTRNRLGDSYYITTQYPQAIEFYDKVIDFGKTDADYAMFQKGFSLGLTENHRQKADVLSTLLVRYPSSPYVPNAIYERGRAYMLLEDSQRSEADFNTIINSYSATPFAPRAMVQLGLLYFNLGDNQKAVAQYKMVIEKYKSTPEARYALTGLKTAYVEMNDVESYFAYMKGLQGYGDINLSEKDSLLYSSGESLYMASDYERASNVFTNYLADYPAGIFRQNAQYYLAESLLRAGKKQEALKLFDAVAAAPNNEFSEQSISSAGSIAYELEDFNASYNYYLRLNQVAITPATHTEALRGLLRSAWQLGDAAKTIDASSKIIASINLPEELTREAIFMKAKANYSLNNFDEALIDFRKLSWEVVSSEGAEAKYRVAEILYNKGQSDESDKVISEFIDQKSPHQFWMARMFILLADISAKKGDLIQARLTLESLRDYYTIDNDGIMDEVRARLDTMAQAAKNAANPQQ